MGILNRIGTKLKFKKKQMSLLVVGLNNSGKSTVVNYFKKPSERLVLTKPTIGYSLEQFRYHGVHFNVVDMSGASRYRGLWQHHLKSCQGMVFVIDSCDVMRLVIVKEELQLLLMHEDLRNRSIPILFYANKQDCDGAFTSVKIATALGLDNIKDKPWHISCCRAVTGNGLDEGVQWLMQQIRYSSRHCNELNTNN